MKRLLRSMLAIAGLSSAACDRPTRPEPLDFSIAPKDTVVNARTSLHLQLQVTSGSAPAGTVPVWISLDTTVATVDAGGFVIAYHPGNAHIVASIGDQADTARVQVLRTLAGLRTERSVLYLSPGDSTRVSAVALDTDHQPMPEIVPTWRSEDPAVATVSPTGSVQAVSYGWTMLRGEAEGHQTTVTVGVFPPMSPECASGQNAIRLKPGEARSLSGPESHRLCFVGFGTHLVLPLFEGLPSQSLSLEVLVPWDGPVSTPLPASALRTPSPPPGTPQAPWRLPWAERLLRRDHGFEYGLRRREERELAPHLGAVRRTRGPSLSRSVAREPAVGDLIPLRTPKSCKEFVQRTGRVAAISRHALVVTDTANPGPGLADLEYQEIAATFDTLVYDLGVEAFGAPTDIDQNGRVLLFFTRAVNELTPADTGSFVGGFHYAGDLFPATECPASNDAEILYALTADPEGAINGRKWSNEVIRRLTPGTLAHELQHLINASRRVHVNAASEWETIWLNEGLSHVAEELTFYRASGISPRSNLSSGMLFQDPERLAAFNAYGVQNLARYSYFVGDLPKQSPFQADHDLETRGAIWSFLRYAADHDERPERELWYELVNSRESGMANLAATFGTDPVALSHTWLVSVAMDDRIPIRQTEKVLGQPSWNSRELLWRMGLRNAPAEKWMIPGVHPTTLVGSSTSILYYDSPMDLAGELRFQSAGAPPPPGFRVQVVRID